ncbi:nitroreductase family protein, partial [Acinetobacter baumannii]|nr:nitroreductase family protein [Acinetobacter baumannii]
MNAKTLNMLDQLYLEARTHSTWLDKTVSPEQIQQIYDLV